jgi:hypothetical protein
VVAVEGRLLGDPELGAVHVELAHHLAGVVLHPVALGGAEGGLVELDGLGAAADRQLGADGGPLTLERMFV